MAMQNWKSFLMPYEQAVDELKVKLKSIRKEYRKRNDGKFNYELSDIRTKMLLLFLQVKS